MNKKIFGALTFALAFAACTNEEELVIATGSDAQLASRPQIGKVELTTESQTRAAVVDGTWGKLAYETGDIIGAALVDEPNMTRSIPGYFNSNGWENASWTYAEYATDTQKKLRGQWKLFTQTKTSQNDWAAYNTPYAFYDLCGNGTVNNIIHTNYGYAYNGTNWTSEASLVEGNYMFYFPYNANNSTRVPVTVEIPTVQDCTDGNSAVDAFYNVTTPIAVDLAFIQKPAAGQKPVISAAPKHLFAYPQIKIVNNFNSYLYDVKYDGTSVDQTLSAKATTTAALKKTMTVNKVELVYTGAETNKLWTKATINAYKLNNEVRSNWEANKFKSASYTSEVMDDLTAPSYDERYALRPYLTMADAKTAFDKEQVLTFNVNKELANGQEYAFNAIMPAENYGAGTLKARVYVTIDGKQYIMLAATNHPTKNSNGVVTRVDATAVSDMYVFAKGVELVRGERYDVKEYNTDTDGNTSVKTSAGNIMTINMSGLTAFEVGNYTPAATTRGFETAAEFVAHMSEATRGTTLTEVSKDGNDALGEHEIAFKNNITINAELVEAIYNNVIYENANMTSMILNHTNLAIANDVTVEQTATAGKYKLSGNGKSIFVEYGAGVINTNGGALVSGINEVAGAGELKKANNNDGIGIVFVSGNSTIKNNANTFRVVVLNGVTLTVTGSDCAAKINSKSGSTVVVEKNLTNSGNNFENGTTIVNNSLKTINGSVHSNNVVTANVSAWPLSVTTDSKVNNVVINPANPVAITVDQASFGAFQNNNTVVVLGANVTSIRSTADVDLTAISKLKQITGTAKWTAATGNIVVSYYNAKDGKPIQISGITADSSVTFNMVNR